MALCLGLTRWLGDIQRKLRFIAVSLSASVDAASPPLGHIRNAEEIGALGRRRRIYSLLDEDSQQASKLSSFQFPSFQAFWVRLHASPCGAAIGINSTVGLHDINLGSAMPRIVNSQQDVKEH